MAAVAPIGDRHAFVRGDICDAELLASPAPATGWCSTSPRNRMSTARSPVPTLSDAEPRGLCYAPGVSFEDGLAPTVQRLMGAAQGAPHRRRGVSGPTHKPRSPFNRVDTVGS